MAKFGSRWQRVQSYSVIGAWANAAWHDDNEFTFEDLDETFYAAGMLGLIWSPQIAIVAGISVTPLNIVEAAALTGLVASYAIGGMEGAETYVDYITDPIDIVKNPEKLETLVQASDIALSVVNPLHIPQKKVSEWLVENVPWEAVFKNRFVTGPYLPF